MDHRFFSRTRIGLSCLLALIFTSCKNKQSDGAGGEANVSPVTHLDDATDFLPGWSKENTVVYHVIAEPNDMHPTNGNSSPRNEINLYTQMSLISTDFKNPGSVTGLIKKAPEVSGDGLVFTYELRDEPRWDDGSPLTLDDFIFTCKAIKCPLTNNPHAKPYWENLKEIRTAPANPKKFMLVMKRQYIQNIAFLTDYPIMQRAVFDPKNVLSNYTLQQFDDTSFKSDEHPELVAWSNEFNNEKYGHDPAFLTGIGMYKMESWEQGQTITLVKKPHHWTAASSDYHEAAYPDKIIFKLNKDDNSSMLEFKSQALDASTNLSAKTLMTLKENEEFNKNYHAQFSLTYNYTYLAMNERPDGSTRKKFFTDPSVRHAMALLTPVDRMLKFVYKNYSSQSRRLAANVSPLKKECDPQLLPVAFDPAKAQQLLEEAGWKDTDGDGIRDKIIDGEKIQFIFDLHFLNTAGDWKDMAAMVAEEMAKVGVKANPLALDLKVFLEKARAHDFDMMMGVWGGSSQNEDYTQLWHTTSWISKGSNYSGFGNAQTDALIDSIKYTMDDEKRIGLSRRLQKVIYDDQPYVFLYCTLRRNVVHKRFGNVDLYTERPGLLLNNLKLLAKDHGLAMRDGVSPY